MTVLEELLRQHTWFTEGSTNAAFRNAGTLGDGWLERYGIDAAVHEFNVQLDRRTERVSAGQTLDELRRKPRAGLP